MVDPEYLGVVPYQRDINHHQFGTSIQVTCAWGNVPLE